jgi:hypothetical protein
MSHIVVRGLVVTVVLTASALAQAQAAEPGSALPATATGPATATEPATTTEQSSSNPSAAPGGGVPDGARFRFGVAGGFGFFTAASEVGNAEVSCKYYGADLRLGAQINDMFGIYAQPTLGYYTADTGGTLAAGGLLGAAVVADVTLIDRFFVGGGLGYTIYNNPSGLTPMLRVGGYPLMSRSDEKARRKGLMLGMDLRFTSLEGLKTIVHPTFNIGYEAF